LQIIGNYFSEARMLNVAHQYQLVTDWHMLTGSGVILPKINRRGAETQRLNCKFPELNFAKIVCSAPLRLGG
jgi:hypothetical protein